MRIAPFALLVSTLAACSAAPEAADESEPALATSSQALTAPSISGRLVCASPDGATSTDPGLGALPIEIVGVGSTTTSATGGFSIASPASDGPVTVRVRYQNFIVEPSGALTELKVTDELNATRSDTTKAMGTFVAASPSSPTLRPRIDLGTIRLSTVDCEIWRIGLGIVRDYHTVRGTGIPRGRLELMRTIIPGTPYAPYDIVRLPNDFLTSHPTRFNREWTLFHEVAHVIRDLDDGDRAHWDWDNFRVIYAREHTGTEISEDAYAFHEGWSDYWAQARRNRRLELPRAGYDADGDTLDPSMDWVENLVGNRLLRLAACVGDRRMLQTLEANPGTIHSISSFESKLCASGSCCGITRTPPAACPAGYVNDGLTCRLNNIVDKPRYDRGIGTIPNQCGPGQENDGGLCYNNCPAGFDGVGPVCWQNCPADHHDDGAFCRRDAQIISADNSACPWYDVCGLTFARGCSTCPAGFQNDGCTCRIDANIFAKTSFGRGVGTIPTSCPAGRVNEAGLCYVPCVPGFSGTATICWGSCPAGFDDLGPTCHHVPHIIQRYPYAP